MFYHHKIAIIIPAYKVESHIGKVVSSLPDYVDQIIVVDDCSPDKSAEAAAAAKDPRLEIIRHEKNTGVGGAMKTGFKRALALGADIAVKMDGDNQMDPEYLPALLHPLAMKECDYIKGNRFSLLETNENMPWIRKLGNQALTFLNKVASGYWHVFDPQNGYLAIRADTLRKLKLDLIDDTYFFENSMLINLNVIEARVSDVYVPTRYATEQSSLKIGWVLRKFPAKLLRGFFFRIFYRYVYRDVSPIFIFLVFGSLFFVAGTLWGLIAWYRSYFWNEPAAIGTIALGLTPIILGFQMLMSSLIMDMQQSPTGSRKLYDFSPQEMKQFLNEGTAG